MTLPPSRGPGFESGAAGAFPVGQEDRPPDFLLDFCVRKQRMEALHVPPPSGPGRFLNNVEATDERPRRELGEIAAFREAVLFQGGFHHSLTCNRLKTTNQRQTEFGAQPARRNFSTNIAASACTSITFVYLDGG